MKQKFIKAIKGGGRSEVKRSEKTLVLMTKTISDEVDQISIGDSTSGSSHSIGYVFGIEKIVIDGLIRFLLEATELIPESFQLGFRGGSKAFFQENPCLKGSRTWE